MACRLGVWIAFILLALMGQMDARGAIERIWLGHRSADPGKVVVNWETARPGNSVVIYGPEGGKTQTLTIEENVTLHHVEIPLDHSAALHYTVATGGERSAEGVIPAAPMDRLRVAVVADWQSRPSLDAMMRDGVQILMTAGDNINGLHELCGAGVKDCTRPYGALIDRYPALFRSVPFMPALGNHDREIRPRGPRPPAEPVYDVEATAFRKFFELPDREWTWHFDIPEFDVRFIALDLNHLSDQGTTWQTCHSPGRDAEQFRDYDRLTRGAKPGFIVTLYNEKNSTVRALEDGEWGRMIERGTIAITGFGYFAERAEVHGFPYYNTSLSGAGARYPDPKSSFFASEDSYILLTFSRQPRKMAVEIKGLDGRVLERKEYPAVRSAN